MAGTEAPDHIGCASNYLTDAWQVLHLAQVFATADRGRLADRWRRPDGVSHRKHRGVCAMRAETALRRANRIVLVRLTGDTLAGGLDLLGIAAPFPI